MPLNRTNDEQTTEMAIFMWKRCPTVRAGLTKKQVRQVGSLGQLSVNRMAEHFSAHLENTTVCKNLSQKGWDLENRTEVKTAATTCCKGQNHPDYYQIQIKGLTNKEKSDHIIAVVYNDVLSKTQVLKIPNHFYRGKKNYCCGLNKETGDINGLQKYIIDEG